MLAEVLLVLAGHPSSFFTPSSPPSSSSLPPSSSSLIVAPALADYLHPGELSSLNDLASLASRYTKVRSWARDIQQRGRAAVLRESLSSKGKGKYHDAQAGEGNGTPDQYTCALASSILDALKGYELLVVETETRILSLDAALVQDANYVPLSALVATFSPWQSPLSSLAALVDRLAGSSTPQTPGALMDRIDSLLQTGDPTLFAIYSRISASLHTVFLTHLTAFLLHGQTPAHPPRIAQDVGPDPLSPQHRVYQLEEGVFPAGVSREARESVLYVGRVAATLKREGRGLPKGVVEGVRAEVMRCGEEGRWDNGEGLEAALRRARAEVGEWLWKHVLTGPQVADALESLGDYFLLRRSDFSLSLVRELQALRLAKLTSASTIREQDLHLCLLRASVATSAESDRFVDSLRFKLDRPSSSSATPAPDSHRPFASDPSIRELFSSFVVGQPLTLSTSVGWPLDLFLTPPAMAAYQDIHAYLFALRAVHVRVLDSWTALSASHRRRNKTAVGEKGSQAERDLVRNAWGIVRAMLYFLDELVGHFMSDIIEVQHRRLLEQLDAANGQGPGGGGGGAFTPKGSLRGSLRRSSEVPAREKAAGSSYAASTVPEIRRMGSPVESTFAGGETGTIRSRAPPAARNSQANFLDFLTLRRIHAQHLSFLLEGLLLADRPLAISIRDILDTCIRFTGLIERWGGDVLPDILLLSEEEGAERDISDMIDERSAEVSSLGTQVHDQLLDFFGSLLESQEPLPSSRTGDASTGTSTGRGGGASVSRTARQMQVSRMMSRQVSFSAAAVRKGNAAPKSQVEREREERGLEAEAMMGRHVEQLLLRLDFNGVLTAWRINEEEQVASRRVLEGRPT